MVKIARALSFLIVLATIISACNLPSNAPPTEEPNAVFTAAALTLQAQLTPIAQFFTPTLPPAQPTSTTAASPTPVPSSTPVPSATSVCDQAQYIKDVTIPDGSTFAPGATFTKTWRLKNAGT